MRAGQCLRMTRGSPLILLIAVCASLSAAACNASESPEPAQPTIGSTPKAADLRQSTPSVEDSAQPTPDSQPAVETRHYQIDGVERTALVILPPGGPTPSPLLIDFHGHGGNSAAARRSRHFEDVWPQAVVVYPQGVPRVTSRDPDGGRNGWQMLPGAGKDADLNLFDSIVSELVTQGWVDPSRVFVTGHSNGAGFTALLAAERGERLAGVAVVHGGSASLLRPAKLPIMFIAARNDRIVDFDRQYRVLQALLTRHGAAELTPDAGRQLSRIECPDGVALGVYLHDGSHAYPPEAANIIADFFKSIEAASIAVPSADLSPSPQ